MNEITVRDYFAGLAMQAYIRALFQPTVVIEIARQNNTEIFDHAVTASFIVADLMMKHREKTHDPA